MAGEEENNAIDATSEDQQTEAAVCQEEQNECEMEELRAAREEEEEVDEGSRLVIDGAKLKCEMCTEPEGVLKVNYDTPTIQEKKTATIEESDFTSLLFFGNCKKSPNGASPCASVMNLGEWKYTGTYLVQERSPLLLRSYIACEYGGVNVTITDCGQVNEPYEVDADAPVPGPLVNGYFYNRTGSFEKHVTGQEEGEEDDVYACDGPAEEENRFLNIKKLDVQHSDFQKIANIVKHEGLSEEENEYIYIAHANYNYSKEVGQTMLEALNTGYSSVPREQKDTPLSDNADDVKSLYTRKGVIDALLRDVEEGRADPSGGATFWDGADFLAWGIDTELKADSNTKTGHNKFDEYDSVTISRALYDDFVSKIQREYPNGIKYRSSHDSATDKGSHKHIDTKRGPRALYTIPASDFEREEYWACGYFYYKNPTAQTYSIEATAVAGYSIFWKKQ